MVLLVLGPLLDARADEISLGLLGAHVFVVLDSVVRLIVVLCEQHYHILLCVYTAAPLLLGIFPLLMMLN